MNRILIVDSDNAALRITSNFLFREGYQNTTVKTGIEALDVIGTRTDLGLIVLDYDLSDVTGDYVRHRIKNDREFASKRNIPIIGLDFPSDKQEGLVLCLDKPLILPGIRNYLAEHMPK